jgi:hypothetical protein
VQDVTLVVLSAPEAANSPSGTVGEQERLHEISSDGRRKGDLVHRIAD